MPVMSLYATVQSPHPISFLPYKQMSKQYLHVVQSSLCILGYHLLGGYKEKNDTSIVIAKRSSTTPKLYLGLSRGTIMAILVRHRHHCPSPPHLQWPQDPHPCLHRSCVNSLLPGFCICE